MVIPLLRSSRILRTLPAGSERRARRDWLRIALTVMILGGCILFLDFGEIIAVYRQAEPGLLAVALGFMIVDRVVMAFRSALLLNIVGARLPFWTLCRFYFQGAISGMMMPSAFGGELLRAYWISGATGVKHPVYSALMMEKMLGFLSAINWAIVGAIIFVLIGAGEPLQWVVLCIAALFAINSMFLWSMKHSFHRHILGYLGRLGRWSIFRLLEKVYEGYAVFSHAPARLALNFLITTVEHLAQLLILLLIAYSLGIQVDPILFLAASAVHTLIFRIPITPDGWGVMEVTAIGIYGFVGLEPEAAFAMMLLAHAMWTLAVAPGLVFLLRDTRQAG